MVVKKSLNPSSQLSDQVEYIDINKCYNVIEISSL